MNKHSDQRITDIVIGEAVMALLDDGAEISWSALTHTLQQQLEQEHDSQRIIAIRSALTEIQDELRACLFSHLALHRPSAHKQLH
ncbi:hypothetical protein BBB56_12900 [Candidatus Pantoea deserta]|uniref:Flagellar protein FliT n=1 Tax=Candidatus Pantoea deserta TaxID=1869313 RepID=A0A3N4NTQ4_9GAMM|nr:hypothetical protein [Pantoea deserta]RPD99741.1 hypothetical protein BBB56_12900 [Pantoea deserta]